MAQQGQEEHLVKIETELQGEEDDKGERTNRRKIRDRKSARIAVMAKSAPGRIGNSSD